jgi:prepilin-type N-terminal cleavage/methylation domain-containing protein
MSPGRRINQSRHYRRTCGFTLLELVTALAVSLIILVALMESLGQASRSWTGQSKSFSEQREARTALRILADDLESIVPLPPIVTEVNGVVNSKPRNQFVLTQSQDPYGSDRFAFLRASRPTKTGNTIQEEGDVRLVMYMVAITPSGGASSLSRVGYTQKLLRRVFSAAETMERIEDVSSPTVLVSAPLVQESDWSLLAAGGEGVEVVADYVIGFKVLPFTRGPLHNVNERPAENWNEDDMPAWVDLMLRVTNRVTALQLRSVADWQGAGNLSKQLSNNTPDRTDDDAEVLTLSMRLLLNGAT